MLQQILLLAFLTISTKAMYIISSNMPEYDMNSLPNCVQPEQPITFSLAQLSKLRRAYILQLQILKIILDLVLPPILSPAILFLTGACRTT